MSGVIKLPVLRRWKKVPLTVREQNIIRLVTEGFNNPTIARKVYITEHMVKNEMRHIFDKLGVWSRLELALWFLHHKEKFK